MTNAIKDIIPQMQAYFKTKPVEKAWQQQFAATYAAPGMKVEFF